MIKIKLTNVSKEFEELSRKQQLELREKSRVQVQKLTEELIQETPIDTGLARASWSINESANNFNIENSTKYIQYLNEGSSQQAPARFIETTALKYGTPLGTIVQVYD